MIEVVNLYFSYNREPLLENINISIKKGITVFRGPNGSGKTTLAKIISGLLPPKKGKVYIDGVDIYGDSIKAKEKLSEVVYVHDAPVILKGTVYKNLVYGLRIMGYKDYSLLEELIQYFGLAKLVDRDSSELSAGERQIVSLVRAFSVEPKYLILDEPLQYLDDEKRRKVVNYLIRLEERGVTIIIATHEQELVKYAKALYYIRYGKVELIRNNSME